jgi:hypothetical protein
MIATAGRIPATPASLLRYADWSDTRPGTQLAASSGFLSSLSATIIRAEVPLSVFGSKDPSLKALAVPCEIAVAIAWQLSSGSSTLSRSIFSEALEESNASCIQANGPSVGS